MLKELIQLANHLDGKGFRKEADHLDSIVTKLASRRAIMDNWNYMNDPRSNANLLTRDITPEIELLQ